MGLKRRASGDGLCQRLVHLLPTNYCGLVREYLLRSDQITQRGPSGRRRPGSVVLGPAPGTDLAERWAGTVDACPPARHCGMGCSG